MAAGRIRSTATGPSTTDPSSTIVAGAITTAPTTGRTTAAVGASTPLPEASASASAPRRRPIKVSRSSIGLTNLRANRKESLHA